MVLKSIFMTVILKTTAGELKYFRGNAPLGTVQHRAKFKNVSLFS